MSHQLINRSADLKQLRDEGYNLEIRSSYLLVRDVPYVNSKKEVRRGTLVSELTLAGDITARPGSHVTYFVGEHPCDENGNQIAKIKNSSRRHTLADGIVIDHTFSSEAETQRLLRRLLLQNDNLCRAYLPLRTND